MLARVIEIGSLIVHTCAYVFSYTGKKSRYREKIFSATNPEEKRFSAVSEKNSS